MSKKIVAKNAVFSVTKGEKGPKATLIGRLDKKKIKSLPNKPIRMGGGPFVGNSTT